MDGTGGEDRTTRQKIAAWGSKTQRLSEMERLYKSGALVPIEEIASVKDKSFSDLITKAVAERMTPDFIEKAVLERVDKLIVGSIDDALRNYSDTGQLIKKAVMAALRVDNLDLPSYGDTIIKILKVQIEATVADLVAGRLAADMERLLCLAPKTIKLSEIAAGMLERSDPEFVGDAITVIVEKTEHGSTWVYLDEQQVYDIGEKYRAEVRLLISQEGTIASATINGTDQKAVTTVGRSYGLDQLIRAYSACGTVIEIDEEFVIIGKGDY